MTRILAFAGSTRTGSTNQQLVDALTTGLADRRPDVDVTRLSLAAPSLPIYDGDLEAAEGLPPGVVALRSALSSHDAFIIGCPEYNGFMTPVLLNALDWASRGVSATPDLSVFQGKTVLIVSTSPGALAGMRAAQHLRTFMAGVGCHVMPDLLAVPRGFGAFGDDGSLADEKQAARTAQTVDAFVRFTEQVNG